MMKKFLWVALVCWIGLSGVQAGPASASSASPEWLDDAVRRVDPESYWILPTGMTLRAEPDQIVTAVSDVVLAGGQTLRQGERLYDGDRVVFGFVINSSDRPILLGSDVDGNVSSIAPGTAAAVTDETDVATGPVAPGRCSVSCTTGYFACCRASLLGPRCKCKKNATSDSGCTQGGHGASSCSITP